jgi:nitroreductase
MPGGCAPGSFGINSQPWRFIVVDDQAARESLCEAAFGGLVKANTFARTAPVLIAVVEEQTSMMLRAGNLLRGLKFYLIDIGIAAEHFVLQADELGLGTCWLGLFYEKKVKTALGIPRNRKVVALLTLGYFDERLAKQEHKRKTLEEMSSFNGWDNRK